MLQIKRLMSKRDERGETEDPWLAKTDTRVFREGEREGGKGKGEGKGREVRRASKAPAGGREPEENREMVGYCEENKLTRTR